MTTKDSTITVRVDRKLKDSVQQDLDAMGLDMSTLIVMTLKAVKRTHTLPFTPNANPTALDRAIAELEAGHVTASMEVEDYLKEVSKYAED